MTTRAAPETMFTSAVASDGAPVPLLVHRPASPRGWIVWAHGGSWQHGSAAAWAPVTAALAASSGWVVVSVEYRLAPAHRFPAAVVDVLAALDWAETHSTELPVVVGGDSAGGTIAASAALARRDTGDRVPAQVLAYPPLDPRCARPSYRTESGAFPNRAGLRAAWRLWLDSTPEPTILPTPLEAPSLAGLAPVSLVVGGDDPVRDDVIAYATRLHADGIPTTLEVLPGVGHADVLSPRSRVLSAVAAALSESFLSELSTPRPQPTHMEGTPS
ncbi:hypothetical protein CIK66_11735 [Brachybacterium alimentarium]|uniref:Alpha/beta hydrolase fold-3 domain-containing protein n=2 Tax=Brachybacterium alimentarium TaxID=47845 RepID=A0A2A3YI63_9MICO|nr:hypothetical protein CIK66_11735 [Brachybacterium alimentarium]RCS76510.1 alpha/beta hydrolase [Brachybacterium alimentarium]